MKKITFAVFTKSQAKSIAESLGFKIKTNKLYTRDKTRVHCFTCLKPITVKNVGNFAKGHTGMPEVYCDNPVCFTSWIARNQIESPRPKGTMSVY